MAAVDYETLAYDRVWDLIEAHTPLTDSASPTFLRLGNRIDWDSGTVIPRKYVKEKAPVPADFPLLEIALGDFSDSLFTAAQRYAFTPTFDPTSMGWTQVLEMAFALTLTHRDQRIGVNNTFELEVRRAIAKGNARLGRQWIQKVGPLTGTRQPVIDPLTGAAGRMQTIFRLPITVVIDGRTQLV